MTVVWYVAVSLCVALGTVPSSNIQKGLLPFEAGGSTGEEVSSTGCKLLSWRY